MDFFLEGIQNQLNNKLTPNFLGVVMESCIFCLNSQNHTSGAELIPFDHIKNIFREKSRIIWNTEISSDFFKTYKDEKRTTDWGAMCIALMLVPQTTEYNDFEVSATNNGFDFWLANDGDELDFSARLEISGIRKENEGNTIKSRISQKLKQTDKSDNLGLQAYIAIIEFGKPQVALIKK